MTNSKQPNISSVLVPGGGGQTRMWGGLGTRNIFIRVGYGERKKKKPSGGLFGGLIIFSVARFVDSLGLLRMFLVALTAESLAGVIEGGTLK